MNWLAGVKKGSEFAMKRGQKKKEPVRTSSNGKNGVPRWKNLKTKKTDSLYPRPYHRRNGSAFTTSALPVPLKSRPDNPSSYVRSVRRIGVAPPVLDGKNLSKITLRTALDWHQLFRSMQPTRIFPNIPLEHLSTLKQ